tara:strand:- start:6081 stop:6224 length:144 start_codon:yes stop_codon:yes gene_type:complete
LIPSTNLHFDFIGEVKMYLWVLVNIIIQTRNNKDKTSKYPYSNKTKF